MKAFLLNSTSSPNGVNSTANTFFLKIYFIFNNFEHRHKSGTYRASLFRQFVVLDRVG